MAEARNQVVVVELDNGPNERDRVDMNSITMAIRDALGEHVEIVLMGIQQNPNPYRSTEAQIQNYIGHVRHGASRTLAVIVGNVKKEGGGGDEIAKAAVAAKVPYVFTYADGKLCNAPGVVNIQPRLAPGQGHRMALERALRSRIPAWEAGFTVDKTHPTMPWRTPNQKG